MKTWRDVLFFALTVAFCIVFGIGAPALVEACTDHVDIRVEVRP